MRRIAAFASMLLCIVVLVSQVGNASAQSFVQYKVEISGDGSAAWTITQASDLNGTIDSYQQFQLRVAELVDSARVRTQREMSLDNNSFQLSTVWETQSHTTRYQFTWQNFSQNQSGAIVIGDVFQVEGFFGRLYGEGEIEISFPETHQAQTVSPLPDVNDIDAQTLEWLGTQLFVKGNPSITLTLTNSPTPTQDESPADASRLVFVVALVAVAVVAVLFAALYFRRRKSEPSETMQRLPSFAVESDEEKIVRMIATSGGSVHQSDLTDQLKFSKAKTSQLLTALEKKGVVTRYKKGRDKIVNLTKRLKGETP